MNLSIVIPLLNEEESLPELHNWIVRADQDRLGPRGEGSFSARLESPPADAYDLEVRFTREGER